MNPKHNSPSLGPQAQAPDTKTKPLNAWVWYSLVLFILLVCLLAFMLYNGSFRQNRQASRVQAAMVLLGESRQELQHLQAEFDALRSQIVIEESTRKGLESRLSDTQAELVRAQEQLAFYDQLLPAGPNGALSLRAFDINRRGELLQYRVLLQRSATGAPDFKGRLQFQASGLQDGQPAQIQLEAARAPAANPADPQDALNLRFDRFQRANGWLLIPEGFEPESVTLKVFEDDVLRLTRKVDLDSTESR